MAAKSRRRPRAAITSAVACALWAGTRHLHSGAFAKAGAGAATQVAERPASAGAGQPRGAGADASQQPSPWWEQAEQLDSLTTADVIRLCSPSLAGDRSQRCAVARGALDESWLGWEGKVAELCSGATLSLFTPKHEGQNTFSRGVHRDQRSFVQPSVALWRWLAASPQKWALRGELKADKDALVDLAGGLGADLGAAFQSGSELLGTSVSLFSGAGGTRTPLHTDNVHAIIFQVEGSKRLFLASRPDIADAVGRGALPEAVLDDGSTDVFCVDGSLEEVHGLREPSPPRAAGAFVELQAGDALVLPAWLYHDVEAAPDDPASLSLTVRFELTGGNAANASDFDVVEMIKQYGIPVLAFHLTVWLGSTLVLFTLLSVLGPEAGNALAQQLPSVIAERLGADYANGDAFTRAWSVVNALSPARLLLTIVMAPAAAQFARDQEWFRVYDEAVWAIDNSLGGSLREFVRGAVSAVSRVKRSLLGEAGS